MAGLIRDEATQAQLNAAEPGASVWLSANAGSGKTRVLTDRVARLLFDGVEPGHILCLTYTKAAASEMQNRLFKRLGDWAMLDNARLQTELEKLGIEDNLPPERLARARTLFALAIETPGGLRIQTIHSFCAALLRRFPLEAGVSPQFTEVEERAADLLRADILEEMASGPEASLVAGVAAHVTDLDLTSLTRDISRQRQAFTPARTPDAIRAAYGVPDGLSETMLADRLLGGDTLAFLALVTALYTESASVTDQRTGAKLAQVQGSGPEALDALQSAILTQAGTVPKRLATKSLAEGPLAPHFNRLEALAQAVEDALDLRRSLRAVERDTALHAFAQRFLNRYEQAKQTRGWLDFDDLIDRTRALLTNDLVAEWVLYRLDGGIDHILVDEAQDTAPRQWAVIERLAQELKAGQGARDDVVRTIFVVGDKKQSIYSFQGADPREFDRMAGDFGAALENAGRPLSRMELAYSFRSADPILRLVDLTFENREAAGFAPENRHKAFKTAMPGRVDLWPVVDKTETADPPEDDWFRPVDRVSDDHHDVTLARRIAGFIRDTVANGQPIPEEIGHTGTYQARPARAGDFLILVRSRGRLFNEVIRACKQAGLPIAGADRLKVSSELAVRDLGALLSFLATPEDSHALAVALKSPLFGLTEQALFDLAHRREKPFLWVALRERRAEFPAVMAVLDDLLVQADFLRPYDLIERILIRHGGRKRLLGRLGDEAQDGIDALLSQALGYEQTEVPSLTGFLQWMSLDDLEIKREMDAAGDRVRVMTVHGAKGLEAPVVILPDCGRHNPPIRDTILADEAGAFWKATADDQPPRHRARVEAGRTVRAEEDDRLLYVAMTRAEKWLVVAAAGELGKEGTSWYDRVAAAADQAGAAPQRFDFADGPAEGRRIDHGDWQALDMTAPVSEPQPGVHVPDSLLRPAMPVEPRRETPTPSDLGGAKALPGPDNADEETAKRRGRLVHLLLEYLHGIEADARESLGLALLRTSGDSIPDADAASICAEALRVLSQAELGWIFAPQALAEVPLSAPVAALGGQVMYGVIDRLIVTDTSITAVDFKSNQTVPETAATCPEALLRQMGAYAAMLAAIYPGRRIETGILWTATAHYMALPETEITAALGRVSAP